VTFRQIPTEALSQGICRVITSEGWALVEDAGEAAGAFKTLGPDLPLVLQCAKETVGLEFVRHGWSGTVQVATERGAQIVALTRHGRPDTCVVELEPGDGDFRVTVQSLAVEGRPRDQCEVWLTGLIYKDAPRPLGRSLPLNQHVRILYGHWGEFLVLTRDRTIPNAIIHDGAWAPDDIKQFKRHIRPGDVVIDIGANFGHHAIVFSKLAGSTGLVVAVEAQRAMFQLLQANAVLNDRENIVAIHAAAGAAHGSAKLFAIPKTGEQNFGAAGIDTASTKYSTHGEEVLLCPLDDLLPKYVGGRSINFIKIDVQSYELYVLRGMERIISRDHPKLFVEIAPYWMRRAGYHFTEVYAFLKGHGYSLFHRVGTELDADGVPVVAQGQDFEWDVLAIYRPEDDDLI